MFVLLCAYLFGVLRGHLLRLLVLLVGSVGDAGGPPTNPFRLCAGATRGVATPQDHHPKLPNQNEAYLFQFTPLVRP